MKNSNYILAAALICLLAVFSLFAQEEKPGALPAWEKGAADAKFVIEVFNDYQCGACGSFNKTVNEIWTKHPNDVLIIYRHFPLTKIHSNAMLAAQAVEAAGKQDKFWEMSDYLLENQKFWSNLKTPEEIFFEQAQKLNLNMDFFKTDLSDPEIINRINLDIERAKSLNVSSTPSVFVNGENLPFEKFSDLEEYLFPTKPAPASKKII